MSLLSPTFCPTSATSARSCAALSTSFPIVKPFEPCRPILQREARSTTAFGSADSANLRANLLCRRKRAFLPGLHLLSRFLHRCLFLVGYFCYAPGTPIAGHKIRDATYFLSCIWSDYPCSVVITTHLTTKTPVIQLTLSEFFGMRHALRLDLT